MSLFDLSEYRVRQLDPARGTKPLDFGGGGIAGSINLDGRFIAINTYHPEYGYVTLTSIPPFPDEDRYDQAKVRAYRKSLVTNEGFGLQFEQEIIKREYFLIEDAVPFMRFTLEDGTVVECVINFETEADELDSALNSNPYLAAYQSWRFSVRGVRAKMTGNFWLQRAAYTQLTEGGVIKVPSNATSLDTGDKGTVIKNVALKMNVLPVGYPVNQINVDGSIAFDPDNIICETEFCFGLHFGGTHSDSSIKDNPLFQAERYKALNVYHDNLVISRSRAYAAICNLHNGCMITDHMILPLLWNRDSYYVAKSFLLWHPNGREIMAAHLRWMLKEAWRGTFWKRNNQPIKNAWARSYMANGMPKDNKALQLDQQLYPFLEMVEYFEYVEEVDTSNLKSETQLWDMEEFMSLIDHLLSHARYFPSLIPTDETPADDELDYPFHFSTTILLWYLLDKLAPELIDTVSYSVRSEVKASVEKHFVTEYKGKQIYSYATDGEGNHYLYHDANDIPLVMMPLWGFCDKDDPIWRNTIDFAFSDDNPGFYDGVLGSVHTPAPWSLGDAQELILCKVIGDRERYQRVWERIEKAAQWDGALPEAYDAKTFEVVSRHWFAWPNAMVAIADNISWDWETEGEYAR